MEDHLGGEKVRMGAGMEKLALEGEERDLVEAEAVGWEGLRIVMGGEEGAAEREKSEEGEERV